MRVIINHLTAIRQKTGIGHHVAELLRCLPALHPDDTFRTFPGPLVTAGLHAWQGAGQRAGRLRRAVSGGKRSGSSWLPALGRGWAAWHFRTFVASRAFDLYHEPNYIPLPWDGPTVGTVHDLSVLRHPEWHPVDRVAHFAQHFEAGLGRCHHLIAVSEFTRRELIEMFGVRPERVHCVYNGIRPELRPMSAAEITPVLARLGLTAPYLLHVGTMEPRKNLLMLMRAYGDLAAPLRSRCPLMLAGGWGWNAAEVAEYYESVARQRGVRLLGYVGDADLPALYNGARALVFPSHYEGFGLPPVEMLACGGAVIASATGAVAETAGPRAHLVDATDLAGWRDAMARVIADDDWHVLLGRGGPDYARAFTWERCARETHCVYAAALGQRAAPARAA
jgi:alpha-1,3-rhamnosyl/mannosyltransferase